MLYVVIDKDLLSIEILDPFRLDLEGIVGKIDQFASSRGDCSYGR